MVCVVYELHENRWSSPTHMALARRSRTGRAWGQECSTAFSVSRTNGVSSPRARVLAVLEEAVGECGTFRTWSRRKGKNSPSLPRWGSPNPRCKVKRDSRRELARCENRWSEPHLRQCNPQWWSAVGGASTRGGPREKCCCSAVRVSGRLARYCSRRLSGGLIHHVPARRDRRPAQRVVTPPGAVEAGGIKLIPI